MRYLQTEEKVEVKIDEYLVVCYLGKLGGAKYGIWHFGKVRNPNGAKNMGRQSHFGQNLDDLT